MIMPMGSGFEEAGSGPPGSDFAARRNPAPLRLSLRLSRSRDVGAAGSRSFSASREL